MTNPFDNILSITKKEFNKVRSVFQTYSPLSKVLECIIFDKKQLSLYILH